jgi:HEAT repeat protein
LELASKIGGSSATAALTDVLPKIPPAVQIALLRALGRRHDRSAAPAIAKMIDSPDPDVRLAAIAALDDLRDGSVALLLARTAAGASGATRAAARQALDDLRPGQVTSTLLKALPQAGPGVQAEIIRALGERGDASAAPKLLELAGGKDESIRSASLQGLALLARPAEIPGMVRLVVTATNEDARSEAADALSSACQRMESQNGKMDATTLVQAVQTGPIDARIALLGVCSGVSDPKVRDALRAARGDHDERVRRAALRALLNSQDVEFLPDILGIARGELKNSHFRILGIRACVRLITQEQAAPLPVAQKIDTLKILQNINTDDAGEQLEAKRLVLSGLASVPDVQTLDMAVSMLDAADVRVEAGDATVKIARAISKDHPRKASAALKRVLAESPEGDVHKSAQAALKKIKPVE